MTFSHLQQRLFALLKRLHLIPSGATLSPKEASNTFINHLTTCQAMGFRLTADDTTWDETQQRLRIRRTAKAIQLSRCDANALEKHILKPKAITPCMTVYSATKKEKHRFPNQVCDGCAPGLFEHYGYGVADTGWCSECDQVGECLDVPLIEHYRKQGIGDDIIYAHLPRLRWCSIHQPEFHQTLEEIESTYRAIEVDSAKSTSMANQQD